MTHVITATAAPPLRRLPVPVREPSAVRQVREPDAPSGVPPTQGTLALILPDAADTAPIALAEDPKPPSPCTDAAWNEHREWALTFVQAAMEVGAGVRSATQLIRWTSLDVQAMLLRRGALAARAQRSSTHRVGKPHVRSLRLFAPCPGVYEVSAVIADRDRVRAVAFRMEAVDRRWRVTELEIG